MQVDLIDFSGPIYRHVDNRFAALRLVQKRFCDAALFNPQGGVFDCRLQHYLQSSQGAMDRLICLACNGRSLCHTTAVIGMHARGIMHASECIHRSGACMASMTFLCQCFLQQ